MPLYFHSYLLSFFTTYVQNKHLFPQCSQRAYVRLCSSSVSACFYLYHHSWSIYDTLLVDEVDLVCITSSGVKIQCLTLKAYISICHWVIYVACKAPLNSEYFWFTGWLLDLAGLCLWVLSVRTVGHSVSREGGVQSSRCRDFHFFARSNGGGSRCGREVMTFWYPEQTETHTFISSYSGGASQKTSNCLRAAVMHYCIKSYVLQVWHRPKQFHWSRSTTKKSNVLWFFFCLCRLLAKRNSQ